ncbi:hypothetical protein NDU88_003594 [Pleurodeles waltl]|uniref:Uncharacterized protein n=1 Tax=Pleurodeles waltl TaxID=8319 RepID=A0AAV7T5T3_PLEWA|nr:hypothetical protein NDU88_003594 [Pleurodeles waltl]
MEVSSPLKVRPVRMLHSCMCAPGRKSFLAASSKDRLRAAPTLRVIRAGAALHHITSASSVCARILSLSSLFTAGTLATSAYHSNLDKEKRLLR